MIGFTWFFVSGAILFVSLVRVPRFHRFLGQRLKPPQDFLRQITLQMTKQFGINKAPRIAVSRANISPVVWWSGGRPLIVIPKLAVDGLTVDHLKGIVAHEMAHVKRLDYYVRWLEWFAVLTHWWNPILWFIRKEAPATEEIACETLMI